MTSNRRKYTTEEIEALPVGTIFAVHKNAGNRDDTVWRVWGVQKAELVSHYAGETEDLEWFATDSPSRTRDGAKPLAPELQWDITVLGIDPTALKRTMRGGKMRIYFNRNITMSPGKLAAHAVHAALTAVGVHHDFPVVVLQAGPTKIKAMRTHIHDEGRTELEPGTLTTGTEWPLDSEER